MTEPENQPQPAPPKEPQTLRSPTVLIGLGALVLGAVGAAFLLTSRSSSPARSPSATTIVIPSSETSSADIAEKKAEIEQELAQAKDESSRGKLQQSLARSRLAGGTRAGEQKPRNCAPGDPLCSDDSFAPSKPAAASPAFTAAEAAAERKIAAPAQEIAMDPNGRFATTYRPGGGHLSAFEAAISQGALTAGDRELVADLGARYAPAMDAPKEKALAFQFDWERAKLQPEGGSVHLRIGVRSSDIAPSARPHLSVHLVLDVSGSMGGKPIEDARHAAQALVDKLDAGDDFSLVTFSTEAKLEIPDGPVGTRRTQIKNTIAGINVTGGTNIGAGLTMGYQQAKNKGIPNDAVKVVLLLSDGRANEGIVQQEHLAKLALDAFQDGIQTSAFGLGTDYDGPLMSAIAADGAGGYYYLRDSEQIAPALATELDKRLDPVATAVEVRIRLKPGTDLLKVYGSRRLTAVEAANVRTQEIAVDKQAQKRDKIKENRAADQEGGMRFFFPAFARDDNHAMLLKLRLPAGVGSKQVALIEVRYKDRISKKNISEETPLTLAYANSDAESGSSLNASVARTVQGFLAGETLEQTSSLVAQGDRTQAARLLSEREGILREAAASLREPLFLRDADRIGRMLSLVQGAGENKDPLVLAMLLETAARVHLR